MCDFNHYIMSRTCRRSHLDSDERERYLHIEGGDLTSWAVALVVKAPTRGQIREGAVISRHLNLCLTWGIRFTWGNYESDLGASFS
jgi:hypothetical protein